MNVFSVKLLLNGILHNYYDSPTTTCIDRMKPIEWQLNLVGQWLYQSFCYVQTLNILKSLVYWSLALKYIMKPSIIWYYLSISMLRDMIIVNDKTIFAYCRKKERKKQW